MSIGDNIKTAREKAGITQKQLSEKIGRGFSTVQKYEMGIITPPLKTILSIASVLNVDPEWLISSRSPNLLEWDETPDWCKDIDGILGKNIQTFREMKGISLSEFSKKIHCEESYVKEIEEGIKYPSGELCLKISKVLGVELSELLPSRYQNAPIKEYNAIDFIEMEEADKRIILALNKLNFSAKYKVFQYVVDLSKIPEYQKKDEPGQE